MKRETFYILITAVAFFAIGLVAGMLLQQGNTQATMMKVASSLEGVTVNINLNETKMVEGIKETFIPDFKEVLNNSMNKDFNKCKPVPCECWKWGCALYCMECEDAISGENDK